jgi:ABC-type glycerol-3-phosphate transport system substrate-binding protein
MDLIIAFLRWLFENDSAEQWMRDEGYLPPTPAQVAADRAEEARQKEVRRLSSYSD